MSLKSLVNERPGCYDRNGKFSFAKVYTSLVLLESLVLMSCSIYGVIKFRTNEPIVTMTLIEGIYVNIYLLFFTISSLKREDSFQMILSAISHIFLTALSSIHYWSQPVGHPFNTALLVMFVTSTSAQLIYLPLNYLTITREFGDYIYSQVGGDLDLQRAYRQGLIFFSLLKLDTFLSLLCLILASVRLVDKFVDIENFTNFGSAAFNLLWVYFGYWCVKKEHPCGIFIWAILGCFGQTIYFSWKTYRIWSAGFYSEDFRFEAKIFFVVAVGSWFFVHVCNLIYALVFVRPNFGRGLIEIWPNALRDGARDEEHERRQKAQEQMMAMARQARFQRNKDLYGSGLHYSNAEAAAEYAIDLTNADPSVNNTHHNNRNQSPKQPLLSGDYQGQVYSDGV